jgi:hypothetical protein
MHMIRNLTLAAVFTVFALSIGAQAQSLNGFAVLALHPTGDPFSGFVGPMRATQSGIDYNYAIVCSSLQNDPATPGQRRKMQGVRFVSIPDGYHRCRKLDRDDGDQFLRGGRRIRARGKCRGSGVQARRVTARCRSRTPIAITFTT